MESPVACSTGVRSLRLGFEFSGERAAYGNEFIGQWDEFFSKLGNAPGQTLGAGVLSAGLQQAGAVPSQPLEILANEQVRESSEKTAFPVHAQTGS
jgi:hypothetical protein